MAMAEQKLIFITTVNLHLYPPIQNNNKNVVYLNEMNMNSDVVLCSLFFLMFLFFSSIFIYLENMEL